MYNNHTQFSQTRKGRSHQALDRSALDATSKNAETLAPQMPRKCPANIKAKSRAEKLALLDEMLSDWAKPEVPPAKPKPKRSREINQATIEARARRKKLEAWLKLDLYKLIEQRSPGERYHLRDCEREDFDAVIARLRRLDPLIRRKIDMVIPVGRNLVRVWFWVGAHHG